MKTELNNFIKKNIEKRVRIVGFATYFGLNEAGVDISAFGAGASEVVDTQKFMN